MKIETTSIKPTFGVFLRYLLITFTILFSTRTLIHIFFSPTPFERQSYDWLSSVIILALGTSLGVVFGGTRMRVVITGGDLLKVRNWTLGFLSRNGLRIKEQDEGKVVFQSSSGYYRMFDHWFKTELVSVKMENDKLTVEGPFRKVDSIDSKLRFGIKLD